MEQQWENDLTEFRAYEHPLLPKRLVKRGFCWPALIVGPAYLIYRRLWVQIIVWMIAIGLIRYLAFQYFQICHVDGSDCYISNEDKDNVSNISGGAFLVGLLVLGLFSNSFWEKDLIKRGYTVTKTLLARSLDEARAIIEREKNAIDLPSKTKANEYNKNSAE